MQKSLRSSRCLASRSRMPQGRMWRLGSNPEPFGTPLTPGHVTGGEGERVSVRAQQGGVSVKHVGNLRTAFLQKGLADLQPQAGEREEAGDQIFYILPLFIMLTSCSWSAPPPPVPHAAPPLLLLSSTSPPPSPPLLHQLHFSATTSAALPSAPPLLDPPADS